MGASTAQNKQRIRKVVQSYMLLNDDDFEEVDNLEESATDSRFKSFLVDVPKQRQTTMNVSSNSFLPLVEDKLTMVTVDERFLAFLMGPVPPEKHYKANADIKLEKSVKISLICKFIQTYWSNEAVEDAIEHQNSINYLNRQSQRKTLCKEEQKQQLQDLPVMLLRERIAKKWFNDADVHHTNLVPVKKLLAKVDFKSLNLLPFKTMLEKSKGQNIKLEELIELFKFNVHEMKLRKIAEVYSNQPEYIVLILIGAPDTSEQNNELRESLDDAAIGQIVDKTCPDQEGFEEEDDDYNGQNYLDPLEKQFRYAKLDHEFFTKNASDNMQYFTNVEIIKVVSLIDKKTTKQQIVSRVVEGAQQAISKKADLIKIYYTGHGCKGTGDWSAAKPAFINDEKDYQISISDIISIIQDQGYESRVQITHDGCYSGNWSYKAKELYDKDQIKLKRLSIDTSSGCTQIVEWEAYRNYIKQKQQKYLTKQQRQIIDVKYQKLYGMTSYDTQNNVVKEYPKTESDIPVKQ